jgi:hypothetical protein
MTEDATSNSASLMQVMLRAYAPGDVDSPHERTEEDAGAALERVDGEPTNGNTDDERPAGDDPTTSAGIQAIRAQAAEELKKADELRCLHEQTTRQLRVMREQTSEQIRTMREQTARDLERLREEVMKELGRVQV